MRGPDIDPPTKQLWGSTFCRSDFRGEWKLKNHGEKFDQIESVG